MRWPALSSRISTGTKFGSIICGAAEGLITGDGCGAGRELLEPKDDDEPKDDEEPKDDFLGSKRTLEEDPYL